MRIFITAILSIYMVTLAGCNPPLPGSTIFPSPIIKPTPTQGFAIYLLDPDIPPQKLAIQSHLELTKTPLISGSDIVFYQKTTHEIELTSAGYEKIHNLTVGVYGKSFAVCVDGQPIYAGGFWADYSSLSFDGIVIDVTSVTSEHPVIQIQLGYPGPDAD